MLVQYDSFMKASMAQTLCYQGYDEVCFEKLLSSF